MAASQRTRVLAGSFERRDSYFSSVQEETLLTFGAPPTQRLPISLDKFSIADLKVRRAQGHLCRFHHKRLDPPLRGSSAAIRIVYEDQIEIKAGRQELWSGQGVAANQSGSSRGSVPDA